MRYPGNLPKNGTIGFAAPSFGASIEPYKSLFDNALVRLGKAGYVFELGPNCYSGDGIGISSTPEKCGRELTDVYCSTVNDAAISVGGGELMCEILDYVDFDRIKAAPPKWFLGYSDNTNFTFLSATLCDTAAIYGPCASSFGADPWHPSIEDALALMNGEKKNFTNYDKWEISYEGIEDIYAPYNCTESFAPILYGADGNKTDSVSMSGRLIGGCIDCLSVLCGTKYDKVAEFCEKYKEDGIIWFLESCDMNTMSFRRAMWELKEAGWFRYCKGFIFGRPYLYDNCTCGLDWENAMTEHVQGFGVPVIRNADLGHLPPMMPFICGGYGNVTSSAECGKTPSMTVEYKFR